MRTKWIGTVLVLLAAGFGCSGGGGGGGGGDDNNDDPVGSPVCIGFVGAAVPDTASSDMGAGSVCGEVVVEVSMTGVVDVFTVSFDANFNTNVARYEGFSLAGSHLSSDGAVLQVVENVTGGQVSLGVTRSGTTTGIDFVGAETVLKLMFSRASGANSGNSGSLSFANTKVLGSETPPAEKPGIGWSGGTFEID